MSFRDLEGGPKAGSHASKPQPKQRREEESSFERSIKANIQEMQDTVRKASEQLDHAQRSFLSRRLGEQLDNFLERSRELSQETELIFRDWTVHLAGEPSERHRKKFSMEKLQKAFEDEVSHLKEVARRAMAAQQEAVNAESRLNSASALECRAICGEQSSCTSGDDMENGLLDDSEGSQVRRASLQEDVTIRNRIAQEREEGIRRIQNQVSEVNQIFRDLASIVHDQGQQFESIETQAEQASTATKQAGQELRKAVDRQRGARERLCCMLTAAVVILCFVILPHMHILEFHRDPAATGAATGSNPISFDSAAGSSSGYGAAPVAVAGWRTGAGAGVVAGTSGLAVGDPLVISKTGLRVT
mmetsp:Transcript_20793/g.46888  ORF Transcript_20793/g.46888 Transcript_20793/m.46888 type:complete len:360 (-) Transcript_20793:51-1130(-)